MLNKYILCFDNIIYQVDELTEMLLYVCLSIYVITLLRFETFDKGKLHICLIYNCINL